MADWGLESLHLTRDGFTALHVQNQTDGAFTWAGQTSQLNAEAPGIAGPFAILEEYVCEFFFCPRKDLSRAVEFCPCPSSSCYSPTLLFQPSQLSRQTSEVDLSRDSTALGQSH